MTPRRLLFATIGYPPFVGGAQSYVKLLAESLVQDGHAVTVIASNAAEVERIWDPTKVALPASIEEINGVRVRRLPLRYLPGAPLAYYAVQRLKVALARRPGISESLLWRLAGVTPWLPGLRRAMAEEYPDLVHGFAIPFESILQAAALRAGELRVPFLMTPFLHVGPPEDPAVRRSYVMPHQVALMTGAAAVVALTPIEREAIVARGADPARVSVVPAGIPVRPLCPAPLPSRPNILFLGALTYDKGAVHLVHAVRNLWHDGVEVGLTLAGNLTGQFSAFLGRLPESDRARIRVEGLVSEERKEELLRACTALALPSRVDSFGLVLLEAWQQGRPVIGARAGGIPAVVDPDVTGLLVPFGDVPALAAAIRRLALHPHDAGRLGAAGQAVLAERYSWSRVYPRLVQIYEGVLHDSA